MPTRIILSVSLVASLALACDEAKEAKSESEASLQANTEIAAADLELATIVELVEREDVKDAESLEALINAEDSTIQVDVDKDGKRDFIAVHEVGDGPAHSGSATVTVETEADGAARVGGKDGQQVSFELRAIPSSRVTVEGEAETVELEAETQAVVVAYVDVELHEAERKVEVEARYAPTVVVISEVEVEHSYVHHVELEHRHDHLVVVGAPFIAWVWIDTRPIYVGHVHLPPGHAKKMGLHWHHGPHKHHGHYESHHGGPTKVKVKSHGGGDKVHVKSHGGGDKVQVKVKSGGHGGGKVHVKGKH